MIQTLSERITDTLTRTTQQYGIPLTPAQIRILAHTTADTLAADEKPATPSTTRRLLTVNRSDILLMVANGATDYDIARRTGRSVETVKTTLRLTYRRLGANGRANAVAIALLRGLIDPRQIWIPAGEEPRPSGLPRRPVGGRTGSEGSQPRAVR